MLRKSKWAVVISAMCIVGFQSQAAAQTSQPQRASSDPMKLVMKAELMPQGDVSCLKAHDGGVICDDRIKTCYRARITEDIADAASVIGTLTPAQRNSEPTSEQLKAWTAGAPRRKRLELLGVPFVALADIWNRMSETKVRCDSVPLGYSMFRGKNLTTARTVADGIEGNQRRPSIAMATAPAAAQPTSPPCEGALVGSCGVQTPSIFASIGNFFRRTFGGSAASVGAK